MAGCGLILAAYGVWTMSQPWACIIVGMAVAIGAEVIAAFPRKPRGL
jgi:hypothetical protein